eukprot:CAMPEP_0185838812 /NCGR_PEP_ID=MMETSP1353-20130828/13600_1 /TAXON_ID=1077150 /ORGANISM="Erythrolobus australicus, Strain CCMP3124" /LENGTH=196 /DNA_ID=CAMNT_0028537901 /DNA_START=286 /DNA_END=873 /DNA_ORIENTATION=-
MVVTLVNGELNHAESAEQCFDLIWYRLASPVLGKQARDEEKHRHPSVKNFRAARKTKKLALFFFLLETLPLQLIRKIHQHLLLLGEFKLRQLSHARTRAVVELDGWLRVRSRRTGRLGAGHRLRVRRGGGVLGHPHRGSSRASADRARRAARTDRAARLPPQHLARIRARAPAHKPSPPHTPHRSPSPAALPTTTF